MSAWAGVALFAAAALVLGVAGALLLHLVLDVLNGVLLFLTVATA